MGTARFVYSFILSFVFTCLSFFSFSQALSDKDIAYFRKYEDSLYKFQKKAFYSSSDSLRLKANAKFILLLDEVLLNGLSFSYPFDSLKETSRLVSTDKKVRIITWNLPRPDGTYHYFGFLQALNPKTNKYDLHELFDRSVLVKKPETYLSDNTKWFGMLYYSIIDCGGYYTLLGWDGNDKLVSRKFIDVLSFKKDGSPVFGKDVFKMPKKYPRRVMFEYSAKVVMSLRYSEADKAIVFDHLSAKDSFSEGMAQFSGPDFSVDAFLFRRGKWVYQQDVDVKNPKSKNDHAKRGGTKEKQVYTPK